MALSGSVTTGYWTADDGTTRGYTLSWTATQNIAENRSTISWKVSTAGTYPWQVAERTLYAVLAGQVLVNKTDRVMRGSGIVAEGSFNVGHASNGTFGFTGSIQAAVFVSSVNCTGSSNFLLNAIPRQANITAAPNFNDEENPTIKYSNPAGNSVSLLEACISLTGETDDIPYREIPKNGSNYTFELTEEERNVLRNATLNGSNRRAVIFFVRTKIGNSTFYSPMEGTFTVIDANPEIVPSARDINPKTLVLTGDEDVLVRFQSIVEVQMDISAKKCAEVVKTKITIGNHSVDSSSGQLEKPESGEVVFSATDSRGNVTTEVLEKEMIPYVKLTCDFLSENPDVNGNFNFQIRGNCFTGSFGETANMVTVFYKSKAEGEDYGEWIPVDGVELENDEYSVSVSVTGLDYTKRYFFQAKVVDLLDERTSSEKIVKTISVFDWSEDDFNFNCVVKIFGRNIFDLIYPVGSIYMSSVDTSPEELFGIGEWEAIRDRFLLGAGETYAANSTGGSVTNTHNHYTASSFDGTNFFAGYCGNVPRSRVVTKNRITWGGAGATTATREDSTYDETIDTMPPYLAVYMWKRIS